jgi:hypothetical protein
MNWIKQLFEKLFCLHQMEIKYQNSDRVIFVCSKCGKIKCRYTF